MTAHLLNNLDAVRHELAGNSDLWIGTDFDGTLTTHQDDAESVQLAPAARKTLADLAQLRRCAVAVISGRSLADLTGRVGLSDLGYAGNHGLEISAPQWAMNDRAPPTWCDAIAGLIPRLISEFDAVAGVKLEDKRLTLSVDYRQCPPATRNVVAGMLDELLTEFPDLWVRHAPMGSEILPRNAGNKGTAAKRLREHQSIASAVSIYLGDDLTDEDAFRALPDAITVHVGARKTQARYRVDSPSQVHQFLDWLLQQRSA